MLLYSSSSFRVLLLHLVLLLLQCIWCCSAHGVAVLLLLHLVFNCSPIDSRHHMCDAPCTAALRFLCPHAMPHPHTHTPTRSNKPTRAQNKHTRRKHTYRHMDIRRGAGFARAAPAPAPACVHGARRTSELDASSGGLDLRESHRKRLLARILSTKVSLSPPHVCMSLSSTFVSLLPCVCLSCY